MSFQTVGQKKSPEVVGPDIRPVTFVAIVVLTFLVVHADVFGRQTDPIYIDRKTDCQALIPKPFS
jgi:hypothetical protein